MGAKTYDVDLGHSGRKIARKAGESKVYPLEKDYAGSPACASRQEQILERAIERKEKTQFD